MNFLNITDMKEYPILYSKDMVLSVLADLKDQTRRLVKGTALQWIEESFTPEFVSSADNDLCPYGKVGDRLWVRETWRPLGYTDPDDPEFLIEFAADRAQLSNYFDDDIRPSAHEKFEGMMFKELKKRGIKINNNGTWRGGKCPLRNRPGIHMWKEFSRIWLEVTNVSIERLLDISEQDALAEGVQRWPSVNIPGYTEYQNYLNPAIPGTKWGGENGHPELSPINSFITLWENINADVTNTNPWVWVIKFKVLSTTGKENIKADLEAAAQ